MHPTFSYWLITFVAVLTTSLAYVFDWNETHVYNPRRPPHAKFHNAQTLLLGPLLAILSLWHLWRNHDPASAILKCSLYWISQLGSLLFPGAPLVDREFRDRPCLRRPMQPVLASILLLLLLVSWMQQHG